MQAVNIVKKLEYECALFKFISYSIKYNSRTKVALFLNTQRFPKSYEKKFTEWGQPEISRYLTKYGIPTEKCYDHVEMEKDIHIMFELIETMKGLLE